MVLQNGKEIREFALKSLVDGNDMLATGLVEMYMTFVHAFENVGSLSNIFLNQMALIFGM